MKIVAILSLLVFTVCLVGAEKKSMLYPLTVNDQFPPEYQKAAYAVAVAVLNEGLTPREYSAEVRSQEGGKVLQFDLWHDSALKQREQPSVRGDPSGKCRTVLYDVDKNTVTKICRWQ